jgi:hypothetical protein
MKAYVGQTRSTELVALLDKAGIGECCVRGEIPPRRRDWFYDNGAFSDFQAKRPFDAVQFMRDMRRITYWTHVPKPAFIIVPDLVAGGLESLAFSLDWLDLAERTGAPLALAVQDGMTPADLEPIIEPFQWIFVGGSLPWKLETSAAWTTWAHSIGRRIHVGRVGPLERVRWARSIGADSIDSSFVLWTRDRLTDFLQVVKELA